MKRTFLRSSLALLPVLLGAPLLLQAHTTAVAYRVTPNGDITFYAANYHFLASPVGGLVIDGVTHNFTSVALSLPADVVECRECPGVWVTPVRYQVVTVSGLASGAHSISPTCTGDMECGWPNCFPMTIEFNLAKVVKIDLKPGGNPNCVNPQSLGVVTVAVYGSPELPIGEIDIGSLKFAGAPVERFSVSDVEKEGPEPLQFSPPDGHLDLILKFDTSKMTFPAPGSNCSEVKLEGKLFSGQTIQGRDILCLPGEVNCESTIPTAPPL